MLTGFRKSQVATCGCAAVSLAVILAGCGGSSPIAASSTTTASNAANVATTSPPATTTRTTPASRSGGAGPAPQRNPAPAAPNPKPNPSAQPAFHYRATVISPALREQMRRTSWHPGCPVTLDQLRYVRIGYWGFDRRPHVGEMVVGASAVPALRRAFAALFAARFPIRRMRLVDHYGGSDFASIQADNTSSFNCRNATGSSRWSEHANGLAIDINPIENPYVDIDGTTAHRASDPYLDRSDVRRGMAVAGGTLVRAFDAIGWGWGGRWPRPTDYQHFSVNGR